MIYLSIDTETTGLGLIPRECNGKICPSDDIIEFGAVFENTNNVLPIEELPKFHCYFKHKTYSFSGEGAIVMNARIIEKISKLSNTVYDLISNNIIGDYEYGEYQYFEELVKSNKLPKFRGTHIESVVINYRQFYTLFNYWLYKCGYGHDDNKHYLNCAGKNFGVFDKRFIDAYLINKDRYIDWGGYDVHDKEIRLRDRTLDPSILFTDWANDKSMLGLPDCLERKGIPLRNEHLALEDALNVVDLLRTQYA